jgi:hypothetical protein
MTTYSEHEQRELDQQTAESGPAPFPKRYIGDGVYATFDGYQIWVQAEGARIALEPTVMAALKQYEVDLYRHYGSAVPADAEA